MELNSKSVNSFSIPLQEAAFDNSFMETWSDRLNEVMGEAGVDASELARRTGISAESIYKYVDGKVANPRGQRVPDIASALGIEVAWLRDGAGPKYTSDNKNSGKARSRNSTSSFDRIYYSAREVLAITSPSLQDWEVERYALLVAQLATRDRLSEEDARQRHIADSMQDLEDYRLVQASQPQR